eukprot:m.119274 g.119274  ORF g.119274 m.119274 type:complete len:85 (-) comp12906_c3_seq4:3403-3657(-)
MCFCIHISQDVFFFLPLSIDKSKRRRKHVNVNVNVFSAMCIQNNCLMAHACNAHSYAKWSLFAISNRKGSSSTNDALGLCPLVA